MLSSLLNTWRIKILTEPQPEKAKLLCCIRKAKLFYLRTVPTNGKYFFPDNVRQVDHIMGY